LQGELKWEQGAEPPPSPLTLTTVDRTPDPETQRYALYTVSTKKVTPCIHCHNSDKQCQILTQFWTNNAMSNCKQITKFK